MAFPVRLSAVLVLAGTAIACSASTYDTTPVNFAGTYTVNLTNGKNDCQLANWTEGAQTSGISIVMSQTNTTLIGTVQGIPGAYLKLIAGTDTFNGNISSNTFSLSAAGKHYDDKPGPCSYNVVAIIDGKQSAKDAIEGTITYKYIDLVGAACAPKTTTCTSVQSFNGTRPPT